LAEISQLVWDKTGTLTASDGSQLSFFGDALSDVDAGVFRNLARQSNHPLSRMLYNKLQVSIIEISGFKEEAGKGSTAEVGATAYRLGSAAWCFAAEANEKLNQTRVYLAKKGVCLGYFNVHNEYRKNVFGLIGRLAKNYKQVLLSGDGPGEREILQPVFGAGSALHFNQKPDDKLAIIQSLQNSGERVLMIGDGLNDAGALKQSNVGISISEDVNTFSPACDAILDAKEVERLDVFLDFIRKSKRIIILSFVLSFSYNLVGLSFAITGLLSPVVSAILMPLSSITIVVFVTLASNAVARKMRL